MVREGAALNVTYLTKVFEMLGDCERRQIGYKNLTYDDVVMTRKSVEWLLGIVLNPAYCRRLSSDSEMPYWEFVRWTQGSRCWPVIYHHKLGSHS